ncbi:MAG: DUF4124 domain-containing protein [Gammaproteobacteria bacterium HGW-Gammaproteobacteria-14]|nr:MAG: DUF4124 domain-containing protein [Gammaproteobacteria bacterium HGW-Gammaproteobacteria-14]
MTIHGSGLYACRFAANGARRDGAFSMKYFFLVLVLIAAVIAALLYLPVDNGRPLLSPDTVKAWVEPVDAESAPMEAPEMYRWQDSQGRWQYGSYPPAGVQAEPLAKKQVKTLSSDRVRSDSLKTYDSQPDSQ